MSKSPLKRQQHCLVYKQAWEDFIPVFSSKAPKNLPSITCFNSDKNDHHIIKYPKPRKKSHPRRLVIVLITSALMRLTQRVLWRLLSNKFRASGQYHISHICQKTRLSVLNILFLTLNSTDVNSYTLNRACV